MMLHMTWVSCFYLIASIDTLLQSSKKLIQITLHRSLYICNTSINIVKEVVLIWTIVVQFSTAYLASLGGKKKDTFDLS